MTYHIGAQSSALPSWLPKAAENYIRHTVFGASIRSVARTEQCHPSTILRQIRRLEAKRDDPLVDSALDQFGMSSFSSRKNSKKETAKTQTQVATPPATDVTTLPDLKIKKDGLSALRRLSERGAILAVARDMETAVVVREDDRGASIRTAIVETSVAQAMALRNWIDCRDPSARIAKYFITSEGRRAVRELTAAEENQARKIYDPGPESAANLNHGKTQRYVVTENPIMSLSRRRDKNGEPFLNREQLEAGEHLRQDFELSDIEVEELRQGSFDHKNGDHVHAGVSSARERLSLALKDLGPGLSDVAIECCCLQNGLEMTEKKMGWSSRSGKIVLRIALTRLIQHYERTEGKFAPMIG